MSSIPPANLAGSIAQTAVTQKQRADEKSIDERGKTDQAKEQASLSDRQEHQVEDTQHTEDKRVRRHDDEESHQQRHRHRKLPEDQQNADGEDEQDESQLHIDLQA
jgi:hypothetical protein